MTRHNRFLVLAALAGGLGLGGAAFAQQMERGGMAPPPPPERGAGPGFAMEMLDGPGGPGGPRGPHGPRGPMIDFVAIDANGDGVLSQQELTARATARLATADKNGDGALDREELIAALPAPPQTILMVFAPNPAAEQADRMLAFMNAGESGEIEISALAARQVNGLLARVDTDRDGAISKAEADAPGPRKGMKAEGKGHGSPDDHMPGWHGRG
jgi:hypothetical protein